jgi:hypothetical protein
MFLLNSRFQTEMKEDVNLTFINIDIQNIIQKIFYNLDFFYKFVNFLDFV